MVGVGLARRQLHPIHTRCALLHNPIVGVCGTELGLIILSTRQLGRAGFASTARLADAVEGNEQEDPDGNPDEKGRCVG